MESRRNSVHSLKEKTGDELILNVANLEKNFERVKSYEAKALEKRFFKSSEMEIYWAYFICSSSQDQLRLSQLSLHFPDEDDIEVPHLPMRLIPYHLPTWAGKCLSFFSYIVTIWITYFLIKRWSKMWRYYLRGGV